jgi:hypothetical protein
MVPIGAVKQAFVRALRDITALKAAVGSDGIDEGVVPQGTAYPRVVYTVLPSRKQRDFGSTGMGIYTIAAEIVSDDQAEAHTLDQLMLEGMEDVLLDFSSITGLSEEPTTLLCHRLRDLSFAEKDDAGNTVYRVGGDYQIQTGSI